MEGDGTKIANDKVKGTLCFFQVESMYTFENIGYLGYLPHWPRGLVGLEVWGLPFWAGNLGCGAKRCSACGATWIPKNLVFSMDFSGSLPQNGCLNIPPFFFFWYLCFFKHDS